MSRPPDFNVCYFLPSSSPREDGKKGWFKQIGVGWLDKKSGQISLKVETTPVSWDGKLRLFPVSKGAMQPDTAGASDDGWITDWDK